MRRRLAIVAVIVQLVLAALVLIAWGRSYWRSDWVGVEFPHSDGQRVYAVDVASESGRLQFVAGPKYYDHFNWTRLLIGNRVQRERPWLSLTDEGDGNYVFTMPYWIVVTVLSIHPVLFMVLRRRRAHRGFEVVNMRHFTTE